MRYSDLVQFEPIETVVQLRDADQGAEAERLVRTYVVSDAMALQLTKLVFPQLRLDDADHAGLLIVGNYGSGKSHLMSVVSAVCEREDLVDLVPRDDVRRAARPVAGRFQTVRTEIGDTEMSLRGIVTATLEAALHERGVDFRFPAADQVVTNKPAFEDMMDAFDQAFPGQGLLLVVDELLDFLRGRKDLELTRDLGFLREIGEVCKATRFRFIAGVQELLFGNPRFAHAADELRRVKDRFQQVLIARDDIEYVVAHRLLRKRADQEAAVRAHLEPFARYYGGMHEQLDTFVSLFPVHPGYVRAFESIQFVEKRQVLRTLSDSIAALIDEPVPDDRPGVVAFDNFWSQIRRNPAYTTIPDVRRVVEASATLENLAERQIEPRAYFPLARRIVHGLSVHRLTTPDVTAPVGLTARALRDDLLLYDPEAAALGGANPDEDLLGHVDVVLRALGRAASGQFISRTPDAHQYYLDVDKTEDYDALVARRAETLADDVRDRYYYGALLQAFDGLGASFVPGRQIWPTTTRWLDRNVERRGYLFFGAPNERPTAIPEREFYVYLLQPFDHTARPAAPAPDEVFVDLARPDDDLLAALDQYAAAQELAASASGSAKRVYEEKARGALRILVRWLQANVATAFDVEARGERKPLGTWLQGTSARGLAGIGSDETLDVADLISLVVSVALTPHFESLAPEYPRFGVRVTEANRPQAAQDALRWLRGVQIKQGAAVLDALGLLSDDRVRPAQSPPAGAILERLETKGEGQVLNRSEILSEDARTRVESLAPDRFRLEPEWVVVVLAALVREGEAVLSLPGQPPLDAARFDALAATPIADLAQFTHISRPKSADLPALRAAYELLGLPRGLADAAVQGESEPVAQLQKAVAELVARAVEGEQALRADPRLFGRPLLADDDRASAAARVTALKGFLETLGRFTTPAKLKGVSFTAAEAEAHRAGLEALDLARGAADLAAALGPLSAYLTQARAALPDAHPLGLQIRDALGDLADRFATADARADAGLRHQARGRLESLKNDYVRTYLTLYDRARLSPADDRRRDALRHDGRADTLRLLAGVDILPVKQLHDWERTLDLLQAGDLLTPADLADAPVPPNNPFVPANEPTDDDAADRLGHLDERLDHFLGHWTTILVDNLDADTVRDRLGLLDAHQAARVQDLLDNHRLPDPVDRDFVEAVRAALQDLRGVTVPLRSLRDALAAGGKPQTPADLKQRFADFVDRQANGHDPHNVRLVIE